MTSELRPSFMRVGRELLPDALTYLDRCGAFLRAVQMEAVCYRVEFQHPAFDGCETQMIFSRNTEAGSISIYIQSLAPAQVDRSPEGQDREDGLDAQHESAVPERNAP